MSLVSRRRCSSCAATDMWGSTAECCFLFVFVCREQISVRYRCPADRLLFTQATQIIRKNCKIEDDCFPEDLDELSRSCPSPATAEPVTRCLHARTRSLGAPPVFAWVAGLGQVMAEPGSFRIRGFQESFGSVHIGAICTLTIISAHQPRAFSC